MLRTAPEPSRYAVVVSSDDHGMNAIEAGSTQAEAYTTAYSVLDLFAARGFIVVPDLNWADRWHLWLAEKQTEIEVVIERERAMSIN